MQLVGSEESRYKKLRLNSEDVVGMLMDRGFSIAHNQMEKGLTIIKADKV